MNDDFNSFDDLLDDSPEVKEDVIEEPTLLVNNLLEDTTNEEEEETSTEIDSIPDYSDNSLYRYLQERGVKDPSKLQFSNENDEVEEVDFNSLSVDEQLEIIKQVSDPGLSDNEINTINYLRQNNVTLEQVVDYFSQRRLEEYLNQHPEAVHQKTYTVDDYTDDDLFLIDLKRRYPDFTDEELINELESAKSNEELFQKKSEILRNSFKEEEDQAELAMRQQEQQQIEDLRNNLRDAAGRFNEIQLDYTDDESDSLIIDNEDKLQMMSYILDQDSEGKSQLIRDLEDPDRLIEIAWFSTQGPKILSELSQYWKGLLANERAENKKLQAKLDKLNKTNTSTVVSVASNKSKNGKNAWDDLL